MCWCLLQGSELAAARAEPAADGLDDDGRQEHDRQCDQSVESRPLCGLHAALAACPDLECAERQADAGDRQRDLPQDVVYFRQSAEDVVGDAAGCSEGEG